LLGSDDFHPGFSFPDKAFDPTNCIAREMEKEKEKEEEEEVEEEKEKEKKKNNEK
jgi:hypothetical protein